jgi:hypothetical protein
MHSLRVTIAFLLVCVLMSCGMQKRLYNKGFYISKRETVKQPKVDTVALVLHTIKQPTKEKNKPLLAQLGKTNAPTPEMKKVVLTNDCDTIFFKNGSAYIAKIVESKFRTVVFYPCYTNMEKPKRKRVSRRVIHHIHYANGLYETKYVDPNSKSTWPLAVIGVVLSITALVFGIMTFGGYTASLVFLLQVLTSVFGVAGCALNLITVFGIRHSDTPALVFTLGIIDFSITLPLIIALAGVLLAL